MASELLAREEEAETPKLQLADRSETALAPPSGPRTQLLLFLI